MQMNLVKMILMKFYIGCVYLEWYDIEIHQILSNVLQSCDNNFYCVSTSW